MNKKNVGMAEISLCQGRDELTIVGLGSCVGVLLYHKRSKTGGLVHIMLPEGKIKNGVKPGRYANTGVKLLYQRLRKKVGKNGAITAKIAGGSQMFKITKKFSVGDKNVVAVKKELKKLGIRIIAEETGKNYGRTLYFNPKKGNLIIKSVYGEKEI